MANDLLLAQRPPEDQCHFVFVIGGNSRARAARALQLDGRKSRSCGLNVLFSCCRTWGRSRTADGPLLVVQPPPEDQYFFVSEMGVVYVSFLL